MSGKRISRRRAAQLRRVRGLAAAIALMTAFALYTGAHASPQMPRQEAEPPLPIASAEDLAKRIPAEQIPAEPEEDGYEDRPFTRAEFDGLIDGVLEEIVTEGMTKTEQARAVFDYVHDRILYTGSSDKSDWITGAYEGLTSGRGDCFTYYAASRAMLTALGIDNLPVERVGGETRHYWNLVDCGGGWYHFDACPRSSKLPAFFSFLFTDRQAAGFTEAAGRCYYDFDGSLLPERAEVELTWD